MRYLSIPVVLGLVLACACGCGAQTDGEVMIYSGDDPSLDGIEPSSWGSGAAVKSQEKILAGVGNVRANWSIKITTQGLYAGGRLEFARPVTLFAGGIDNKRYVQFTFFFKDTKRVEPGVGTSYWSDIEPYDIPTASKMRFMFVSDDGVTVAAEQPTVKLDPDDNWMRVAVPLAKFRVNDEITSFRLKRLVITTDVPTTLYLGQVKLVTDATPIKVEPLDSQSLVVGDEVMWVAQAEGGVSSLRYSWDFDARNGIQEETTGLVGRYVYLKAGSYTVSLTVKDTDGLKAPVTVTAKVDISD